MRVCGAIDDMTNPYVGLEDRAFWKLAVASRSLFDLTDLWKPKFDLKTSDQFVTFGSCFAQHIGRALATRGFAWFNGEPAPRGLSASSAKKFNYNVFSARTGNIYTTSILAQWVGWAAGSRALPDEVWENDGRFYDPFRPAVEPGGFGSPEEMQASRKVAIAAFRTCIDEADYFVFTLGLTESWRNNETGYEYPMCPGTVAGIFDERTHAFDNHSVMDVLANLEAAMDQMKSLNPNLRFILTVSPVPLTATKSGHHVMVATMQSKSVLRAVAGQLARQRPDVDYFPSYEIINSPVTKAVFFEPNQRDVNPRGVDFVMDNFFNAVPAATTSTKAEKPKIPHPPVSATDDVVCEEELLQAFGGAA